MKDSQKLMMEHSEVKVELLKLYMQRYLNILNQSKFVDDIYLFDLFCAEGIYENGGKGSPIVFLETIKDIHFANKTKNKATGNFHCFFNDLETEKIEKLKVAIKEKNLHYEEMGGLHFSNKDYKILVPKVCAKINTFKNEKAFVFIDPYGYKEIAINDIRNLLSSGKSEVLLFLPTQFMFRFESKATPESLKRFISELLPEEEWPKSQTGIEFIEKLKIAFKNSLEKHQFVDTFIISRDKNQFFCLFFFTSHIYGFDRMLDAKWKLDEEQGRGWAFNTKSDLFSTSEKSANTLHLEKGLKDFLKTPRTNGEIYEFSLHLGYLSTHTNQVLTEFNNNGMLVINSNENKIRKGAFYVNYQNYKEAPDKLIIKIK